MKAFGIYYKDLSLVRILKSDKNLFYFITFFFWQRIGWGFNEDRLIEFTDMISLSNPPANTYNSPTIFDTVKIKEIKKKI